MNWPRLKKILTIILVISVIFTIGILFRLERWNGCPAVLALCRQSVPPASISSSPKLSRTPYLPEYLLVQSMRPGLPGGGGPRPFNKPGGFNRPGGGSVFSLSNWSSESIKAIISVAVAVVLIIPYLYLVSLVPIKSKGTLSIIGILLIIVITVVVIIHIFRTPLRRELTILDCMKNRTTPKSSQSCWNLRDQQLYGLPVRSHYHHQCTRIEHFIIYKKNDIGIYEKNDISLLCDEDLCKEAYYAFLDAKYQEVEQGGYSDVLRKFEQVYTQFKSISRAKIHGDEYLCVRDVQAQALMEQGIILDIMGDSEKAAKKFITATQTAASPYLRAEAHMQLGRMIYADSPERNFNKAKQHLVGALKELERRDIELEGYQKVRILIPIATVYKDHGDSVKASDLIRKADTVCQEGRKDGYVDYDCQEEVSYYQSLWKI